MPSQQIKVSTTYILKIHYEIFPPKSNIQMYEKATVGIHLNSEVAKTGLIANSNIRQITDECE